MRICPYMYPELCYGNIDGSLYTVDLIQSQEYFTSQNIIESLNSEIKVLCEYGGMSPRQIFMSRNDKLNFIDLRESNLLSALYN